MKKTFFFTLLLFIVRIGVSQDLHYWTYVNVNDEISSNDCYLFTASDHSLAEMLLKEIDHASCINSILIAKDINGTIFYDPNDPLEKNIILKALKTAYLKIYFQKEGYFESRSNWLANEDVDTWQYKDEDRIYRTLVLPTAFADDNEVLNPLFNYTLHDWFYAQIWADLDIFTAGMRQNHIRRAVYEKAFLTIGSPIYGDEFSSQELELFWDNIFGERFNDIFNGIWNGVGTYENIQGFMEKFLNAWYVDLNLRKISPIYANNIWNFRACVQLANLSKILLIGDLAKDAVQKTVKGLLIHSYSNVIGLQRLESLKSIFGEEYSSDNFYYDPVVPEALSEAIEEYRDRMNAWFYDAMQDILSDKDFYIDAANIAIVFSHISEKIALYLKLKSFGPMGWPVTVPIFALNFSLDKYFFIQDQKDLFQLIVVYATLHKTLQELANTNNIEKSSSVEDMLNLYDAIRFTGYSFYLNYADRMDANWWSDLLSKLENWLKGKSWNDIPSYKSYLHNMGMPILKNFNNNHADKWTYEKEQIWLESLIGNNFEVLYAGSCEVNQSNVYREIYFSVKYKNILGAEPQSVSLIMDGLNIPLEKEDGEVKSGAIYSMNYSTLKTGFTNYHFEAISANGDELRFPAEGELTLLINDCSAQITNATIQASTDQTSWSALSGSLSSGFEMLKFDATETYYFDVNTVTFSETGSTLMENHYNAFYLDGSSDPLFYLLYKNGDYTLIDGAEYESGNPDVIFSLPGNTPMGKYKLKGNVLFEDECQFPLQTSFSIGDYTHRYYHAATILPYMPILMFAEPWYILTRPEWKIRVRRI
jgi:hypothetical protein